MILLWRNFFNWIRQLRCIVHGDRCWSHQIRWRMLNLQIERRFMTTFQRKCHIESSVQRRLSFNNQNLQSEVRLKTQIAQDKTNNFAGNNDKAQSKWTSGVQASSYQIVHWRKIKNCKVRNKHSQILFGQYLSGVELSPHHSVVTCVHGNRCEYQWSVKSAKQIEIQTSKSREETTITRKWSSVLLKHIFVIAKHLINFWLWLTLCKSLLQVFCFPLKRRGDSPLFCDQFLSVLLCSQWLCASVRRTGSEIQKTSPKHLSNWQSKRVKAWRVRKLRKLFVPLQLQSFLLCGGRCMGVWRNWVSGGNTKSFQQDTSK